MKTVHTSHKRRERYVEIYNRIYKLKAANFYIETVLLNSQLLENLLRKLLAYLYRKDDSQYENYTLGQLIFKIKSSGFKNKSLLKDLEVFNKARKKIVHNLLNPKNKITALDEYLKNYEIKDKPFLLTQRIWKNIHSLQNKNFQLTKKEWKEKHKKTK